MPAYLQLIFCNLLITGSSISSTIVLRTATNRCTLKEEKTLSPRTEKASCGCDDSATIELEQRFDSPPNALQAFRYMFLVSFSERNCLDIRLRRKRRWDSLIFARNASFQIIPPRSCSWRENVLLALQGIKGIPSSGIWAKLTWYQSLVACG